MRAARLAEGADIEHFLQIAGLGILAGLALITIRTIWREVYFAVRPDERPVKRKRQRRRPSRSAENAENAV